MSFFEKLKKGVGIEEEAKEKKPQKKETKKEEKPKAECPVDLRGVRGQGPLEDDGKEEGREEVLRRVRLRAGACYGCPEKTPDGCSNDDCHRSIFGHGLHGLTRIFLAFNP